MGFSSWKCPVCGLPIMAGISVGTVLSHIALVRPCGTVIKGTYDGYGRLAGLDTGELNLWPLVKDKDPGDEGWGVYAPERDNNMMLADYRNTLGPKEIELSFFIPERADKYSNWYFVVLVTSMEGGTDRRFNTAVTVVATS